MSTLKHLLGRGLLLAALTQGAMALAQPVAAPVATPWVQVECIVFRQLDASAGGNEAWPEQPAPGYPAALRFLLTREQAAQLDAAEQAAAASTPAADASLAPVTAAYEASREGVGTADLPPTPAERAFVQLPPEQRSLQDAAARMAGSARVRVLAHLAWRQPLPAPGTTDAVLLTGGQPNGTHFELEGSIALSQSRFLHVGGRIWLNDFAAPGSLATGPQLPEVPVAPPLPLPAPDAVAATNIAAEPPATVDPATAAPLDPALAAPEPPPPVHAARSVQLDISRRVQYGELHYLDHPLFGVLVRVLPWNPAQPATAAPETGVPPAADTTPAMPASGTLPTVTPPASAAGA